MQKSKPVESNADFIYVTEESIQKLKSLFDFVLSHSMQIVDLGKFTCLVNSIIFQKQAMMIPRSIQGSVLPSVNGQIRFMHWYPASPNYLLSTAPGGTSGDEVMMYEKTAQQILSLLEEEVNSIKEFLATSTD